MKGTGSNDLEVAI